MRLLCLLALALFRAVYAQSSTVASPSSTATPTSHVVYVGYGDGDAFSPANLSANVGDTIVFTFVAQGHSVVQAEFGNPCIPYSTEPDHRGDPMFFSGFFNGTDTNGANPPTWNLTVNSTDPVFFYCSRLTSCLDHDMLGVINPNATQTRDAQIAFIDNTTIMLQPGEPFPEEGSSSTTTPTSHKPSLSTGAIVGIAIGGAAALVLLTLFCCLCARRRRRRRSDPGTNTVHRWMNSLSGTSSTAGYPPPYDPNAAAATMETNKNWETQPLYGGGSGSLRYSSPPPPPPPPPSIMQPQVLELGERDVVEIDGREGSTRVRSAEIEALRFPKREERGNTVYEKE